MWVHGRPLVYWHDAFWRQWAVAYSFLIKHPHFAFVTADRCSAAAPPSTQLINVVSGPKWTLTKVCSILGGGDDGSAGQNSSCAAFCYRHLTV